MTDKRFVAYYEEESQSDATVARFAQVKKLVTTVLKERRLLNGPLRVADIGCGAGTQSIMWAQEGHDVHGIDISEELVDIANGRAENGGLQVKHSVASATELPWSTATQDVCLVPELLEHVEDWESCIDEFARILRPNGVLFISTTNRLCPIQQEYRLPLYSWYPERIKRYCERAAVSTHPHWVNYATFPAVNWFSYYSLKRELAARGIETIDRFDVGAMERRGGLRGKIDRLITKVGVLRFVAHVLTPYTLVIGIKRAQL